MDLLWTLYFIYIPAYVFVVTGTASNIALQRLEPLPKRRDRPHCAPLLQKLSRGQGFREQLNKQVILKRIWMASYGTSSTRCTTSALFELS